MQEVEEWGGWTPRPTTRSTLDYALQFGRGMGREDLRHFVGMYVNEETRELSARGREGLQRLLDEASRAGLIPHQVPIP